MRISDWSSDVCSSDLPLPAVLAVGLLAAILAISSLRWWLVGRAIGAPLPLKDCVSLMFIGGFFTQVLPTSIGGDAVRSEEHTSELQSLMRISYAVFCLKKKKKQVKYNQQH